MSVKKKTDRLNDDLSAFIMLLLAFGSARFLKVKGKRELVKSTLEYGKSSRITGKQVKQLLDKPLSWFLSQEDYRQELYRAFDQYKNRP